MRLFNGTTERLLGTAPTYDGNSFQAGFCWTIIGGGPQTGGTIYDDGRLKFRFRSTDSKLEITIRHSTTDLIWESSSTLDTNIVKVAMLRYTGSTLTVWNGDATTDMTTLMGTVTQAASGTVNNPSAQAHVGENESAADRFYGRIGQLFVGDHEAGQTGTQRRKWQLYLIVPLSSSATKLHLPMLRPITEPEQDVARSAGGDDPLDRLEFACTHTLTTNSSPTTRYYAEGASGDGSTAGTPSGNILSLITTSAAGDLIEIDGSAGALTGLNITTGLDSGAYYARRQHVTIRAKAGTDLLVNGDLTIDMPWLKLQGAVGRTITVNGNLGVNRRGDNTAIENVTVTFGELRVNGAQHGRVSNCVLSYEKFIDNGAGNDVSNRSDAAYFGNSQDNLPCIDWVCENTTFGPIGMDIIDGGDGDGIATAHVDAMQTGCGRHLVFRWCKFLYGASQTLQFGNEGGPLDGVLFDHCVVQNPGEDQGTLSNQVNLANVNSSGPSGIHRYITFIHCTLGAGSGPALGGTLDQSTQGGSGFYSQYCRIENSIVGRNTVGSSLNQRNLYGSDSSLSVTSPLVGSDNRVADLEFGGDPDVRPEADISIPPAAPGAGYASTTIGTKVRDGLGVAYAVVTNIDITGATSNASQPGWGAYSQSVWQTDDSPILYRYDGYVFTPYEIWKNTGPSQPWRKQKPGVSR